MKKILLFFPDCPINETNGAGIYLLNVIQMLNRYYNLEIYCLVGRYNWKKMDNNVFNNAIFKNVHIIHAISKNTYKTLCNFHKTWKSNKKLNLLFYFYKNYFVMKKHENLSLWYLLLNKIIDDYNIDYTIIRDTSFLLYYNVLLTNIKTKINNLFIINIPPIINHRYNIPGTRNFQIFKTGNQHLVKTNLFKHIYITPNDFGSGGNITQNDIYLPPMIFSQNKNNSPKKKYIYINDYSNNIISFTGTLVDAQKIIKIIKTFDIAITTKILNKNFILNITGKDCFSHSYKIILNTTIKNIKNKKNLEVNISKNGIDQNIINEIIENSVLCIRLDEPREVISTKVLNYIKAKKPIILQKLNVHTYLFGDDYPFYIEKNLEKCQDSIYKIFCELNNKKLKKAIEYIEKGYNKSNDLFLFENNHKLKQIFPLKPKENWNKMQPVSHINNRSKHNIRYYYDTNKSTWFKEDQTNYLTNFVRNVKS